MHISIPIEMTKSYNADFDGDEVVLIPLTSKRAVAECSAITSAVKKPFSNQLSILILTGKRLHVLTILCLIYLKV